MPKLIGFTAGTRIIDPRTGDLTSEGFRLIQSIVESVNGSGDVVTLDGVQTLTNKTIDGDTNTLQDIATASLKTKTGIIARVVTGTAGSNGNFVGWNANGDAVDSGKAAPSGAVVGTTDTQTLTNKGIDAAANTISNLDVADFDAAAIVTAADTIAGNDNDTTLPTSAAVKDYADSLVTDAVQGPASATDNNIATFDGTTGKLIQDGGKGLPTGAVVGTTDTQTLTNKTLTTPDLTLQQSASPTPTAEGNIQWDTGDDLIVVGDGSGQKIFYPASGGAVTPTVVGTTSAGSGTYTTQTGEYQRHKDVVTFQAAVSYSAHTGTGNLTITLSGLPANPSVNTPISFYAGGLTFSNQLTAYIDTSGVIQMVTQSSGAGLAAVAMDAAASINVAGVYFV